MRFLVIVFLMFPFLLRGDEFADLSGAGGDARVDKLSFTGTQRWGSEFLKVVRLRPKYLGGDWLRRVSLPVPPANSSLRTEAEVGYLESLVSKRAGKMGEIKAEVHVTEFRYGRHTYQSLTSEAKYRATGKVILAAYHDLAIATFVMKQRFDRVRPSVLKRELGEAIEIPAHPAYPSGHATGAYTLAYLLQELDSGSAKVYLGDARRISENREVAGLHYPSDTEAGRLLARQLTDLLLSNSRFQRLMAEARKEWL